MKVKSEVNEGLKDLIDQRVEEGANREEIEACVIMSDVYGLPVERCLTASELETF